MIHDILCVWGEEGRGIGRCNGCASSHIIRRFMNNGTGVCGMNVIFLAWLNLALPALSWVHPAQAVLLCVVSFFLSM
jgi:hypothetical protein